MNEKQKIVISTGSWLRLVVVLAIAYAAYLAFDFILVLIASIVIASAIEPATLWAKRQNIPRLPAVLFVYLGTAIFVAGLFYFLLLPLLNEMTNFVKTLTIYSNSVVEGGVLSELFKNQHFFGGIDTPGLFKELSAYLNEFATFLSQGVFSSLSVIFGGVLNFGLIVVISFYLAVQEDGVGKFLQIVTPLKHERYVVELWRRSQKKIGLWMQGQLLSSALIMIMVYIGLLIAGVPNALLLAVFAGVFELIPLFGATLAAIPALFISYISGGMPLALIVAAIYIFIQQLESNIIYPIVVKKVVGVPPLVSIIALVLGGTLAGFLGVLVSVPVAAAIIEFISDLEQRKVNRLSETTT